jgi:hypothetical protein
MLFLQANQSDKRLLEAHVLLQQVPPHQRCADHTVFKYSSADLSVHICLCADMFEGRYAACGRCVAFDHAPRTVCCF